MNETIETSNEGETNKEVERKNLNVIAMHID
jgi:hypothetical protein